MGLSETSPKVSVVVATFNAGATIDNLLRSAANQTYQNLEVVVIDGGSTDNTIDILEKYSSGGVRWISEPDEGIYDALNKGIFLSQGDWLIFMGSDDVFYSARAISDVVESNVYNCDIIYGDVVIKTSKKRVGYERDYIGLVSKNICHQAIFYSRKIFKQFGFFSLEYPVLADYAFNLRIFKSKDAVCKYVPIAVTLYNNRGYSNRTIDKNFFRDHLNTLLVEEGFHAGDPGLQQYHFFCGIADLWEGKIGQGMLRVLVTLVRGDRKMHRVLLFGMCLLARISIGKRLTVR